MHDNRVLSGAIFGMRDGLRWRYAPADYGPHKTIYKRFIRWLALKAGGPDPRTSTIIPVVLYAFPYARPSEDHEVAIADWSGVTRFFRGPTLGFTTRHRVGEGEALLRRHETTRLWRGDTPTVDDFIAHLRAPSQVTLKAEALEITPGDFYLCDHRGARTTEVVAGNPRSAATPRFERALQASIARAERDARAITRRKLERELRQTARRSRKLRQGGIPPSA